MSRKHDDRQKLEFEGHFSANDAAEKLDLLAEGLRKHALQVEAGEESLDLAVADDVDMALEVRSGSHKNTILMEMTWTPESSRPAPLQIEPVAPPAPPRAVEAFAAAHPGSNGQFEGPTPSQHARTLAGYPLRPLGIASLAGLAVAGAAAYRALKS